MSELRIPEIPQYGIIIEKEYEQSIFHEIYSQAIENVADIISENNIMNSSRSERYEETINPLIAFVGGRGTGKSSAMSSFSSYLNEPEKDTKWIKNDKQKKAVSSTRFHCLPCIDASQLSEKETVLGRIAAEIYSQYSKYYRNNVSSEKKQDFIKISKEVTELAVLNRTGDWFSTGDRLLENAERIGKIDKMVIRLVRSFLDMARGLPGKDCYENHFLVVSIDDLDMGVSNSYAIMEEIRKFLFIPNVIVLITLDEALLDRVLQSTFSSAPNSLSIKAAAVGKDSLIRSLSYRYIEKLIPYSRQHFMPVFSKDQITKVKAANLLGDNDSNWKKYNMGDEKMSVLNGVLHLIWRKTMMIPVCDKDDNHLIVPRNLRSLCNMIIFLRSLSDVAYDSKESNGTYKVLGYGDFVGKDDESQARRSAVNNNINAFSQYLIENVSSYNRTDLTDENDALADVLLHLIRIFPNIRLEKMNVQIVGDILYHIRNYNGGCFYKTVFKNVIDCGEVGQTVRDDLLEAVTEYPDSISSGDVMYVLGKLDTKSCSEYIRYLVEVIRMLWSARMTQEFYYNGLDENEKKRIASNKFITENFRHLVGGFIINPNNASFCNYINSEGKSFCGGTDWYSDEIFDELGEDMCKLICVSTYNAAPKTDHPEEHSTDTCKEIDYRKNETSDTPYYKIQGIDATGSRLLYNPMSIFTNLIDTSVQKNKIKLGKGKFECKTIDKGLGDLQDAFNSTSGVYMIMPYYSLDYLYRFFQQLRKMTSSQSTTSLFRSIVAISGSDKSNPTNGLAEQIRKYIPTEFVNQITKDSMKPLSNLVGEIKKAFFSNIASEIKKAKDQFNANKAKEPLCKIINDYKRALYSNISDFDVSYSAISVLLVGGETDESEDKNDSTILDDLGRIISDLNQLSDFAVEE